jgi:hypothetical protein
MTRLHSHWRLGFAAGTFLSLVIACGAESVGQMTGGGRAGGGQPGQPGAQQGGGRKTSMRKGAGDAKAGSDKGKAAADKPGKDPIRKGAQKTGNESDLGSGLKQLLNDLTGLRGLLRDFAAGKSGEMAELIGGISKGLEQLRELLTGLESANPADRASILAKARGILDSLTDDLEGLGEDLEDKDLRPLLNLHRRLRRLDRGLGALPLTAGGRGSRGQGGGDGGGVQPSSQQIDADLIPPARSVLPATKEDERSLVKNLLAQAKGTADALSEELRKFLAERPSLREALDETKKELDQLRDDLGRIRNAPLSNITEVTAKMRLTSAKLKDKVDESAQGMEASVKQTLNRLSSGLAKLESELEALAEAAMAKANK